MRVCGHEDELGHEAAARNDFLEQSECGDQKPNESALLFRLLMDD